MSSKSNVCVCPTCAGSECTCGNQVPATTPAASYQCDGACTCGPACSCDGCQPANQPERG